ncbi:2-hydroxyacyl-CoA dehydratase [Naasia aerilata]|uniref:HTH marR-type domain-containing protein n=1 Tax=Naasia aerilata TaxID=1162966 RepID=A0ABM8GCS7_9MICO|nr:2-hydroxyacyl-CoA dehydratase [Naasia aerilata]BDZ46053.1 hypothetical protein GCM10025866_19620 [Naasia aerilata]
MTRLASASAALAYQRAWFTQLREATAGGEDFALVNADAPQEILRAMGIPYVVNQWWASIVTAKQVAGDSLEAVARSGYPDDSRQYDVLALGSRSLSADAAPWGGLPKPRFVIAELSGDATGKVFEAWTDDSETEFFPYERTAAVTPSGPWWELAPRRWEHVFGRERIELMAAENRLLIEFLEERTGRTFEPARLVEVMDLINEQEELNRQTRDLIAAARPTPVRVSDTIPAVMIPQWHRGSEWGRDAAGALRDEVAGLVSSGASVAQDERLRLMWVGRGLWGDTSVYRRFEDEFGAVFVWSMYLAIAADGYIRYGDDPIEALAARFVGITDLLYAPARAAVVRQGGQGSRRGRRGAPRRRRRPRCGLHHPGSGGGGGARAGDPRQQRGSADPRSGGGRGCDGALRVDPRVVGVRAVPAGGSEPARRPADGQRDGAAGGVTLLYLIKQVELAIRARLEAETRGVGLTVVQYTAMTVLERRPGLTSAELAKNSFVRAQSMATVTAELEERELISRRVDPAHHRHLLLSVTPAGLALLDRLRPAVDWIEEQMVSALSETDVERLRRTLQYCRFSLGGGWPH